MEIGSTLLWFALILAILVIITTFIFYFIKNILLRKFIIILVFICVLVINIVYVLLIYNFQIDNFDIHYVWLNSSENVDWTLKLAGTWHGQEGSFLLWVWLIVLALGIEEFIQYYRQKRQSQNLTSIYDEDNEDDDAEYENDRVDVKFNNNNQSNETNAMTTYDWTRLIVMLVVIVFLILLLFNDPFEPTHPQVFNEGEDNEFRINPENYPDGHGMNPMNRNFWMVIHPPLLFIGYALITIPFAASISYAITNDKKWTKISLQWSRLAWLFLTLGIGVGALWAYVAIGWGGYWFWDAVEVGSLVPWITLSAFLHMQLMNKRKSEYRIITPILGTVTIVLVLFATFITRSGLWTSIHAWSETEVGLILMVVMILILIISALTIIYSFILRKIQNAPISIPKPDLRKFKFRYIVVIFSILSITFMSLSVVMPWYETTQEKNGEIIAEDVLEYMDYEETLEDVVVKGNVIETTKYGLFDGESKVSGIVTITFTNQSVLTYDGYSKLISIKPLNQKAINYDASELSFVSWDEVQENGFKNFYTRTILLMAILSLILCALYIFGGVLSLIGKMDSIVLIFGLLAFIFCILTPLIFMMIHPSAFEEYFQLSGSGPWESFTGASGESSWGPGPGWILAIMAFIVALIGFLIYLKLLKPYSKGSSRIISALKYDKSDQDEEDEYLEKEEKLNVDSLTMKGTLTIFVICTIITVYVLIATMGEVNAAFYETKLTPFIVILLAILTICLCWRYFGKENSAYIIAFTSLAGVTCGALLPDWIFPGTPEPFYNISGFEISSHHIVGFMVPFVVLAIFATIYKMIKQINRKSIKNSFKRISPHLIHLGVVLIIIAYAASQTMLEEKKENLRIGDTMEIGEYEIKLTKIEIKEDTGDKDSGEYWDTWFIDIEIYKNNEFIEKGKMNMIYSYRHDNQGRRYPGYSMIMSSEVHVARMPVEDLHISFLGVNDYEIQIIAQKIPMMSTLWLGMFLFIIGITIRITVDSIPTKKRPPQRPIEDFKTTRKPHVYRPEKIMRKQISKKKTEEKDYDKLLEDELKRLRS